MAKYYVLLMPTAEKDLSKIDYKIGDRIIEKLDSLETNSRPSNSKKLSGQQSYRLRIGDYRALYEINEVENIIIVFRIGHRREVYRK